MLSLRPYQNTDGDNLIRIWYESWHSNDPQVIHPQPYEGWVKRWNDEIVPKHEISVAERAGQILGFCAINIAEKYLSQLYIDPNGQGTGAGSALLNWAKSVCPAGFKLQTLTRNTRSRRFYEQRGLTPGQLGINPLIQMENIQYIWDPGA